MTTYQKNGYESRKDYLMSISDDFGIDIDIVLLIAGTLGEDEDFDGLISTLQDYEDGMDF